MVRKSIILQAANTTVTLIEDRTVCVCRGGMKASFFAREHSMIHVIQFHSIHWNVECSLIEMASLEEDDEAGARDEAFESEDPLLTINVLHFGHAFTHKIPSWPIFSVDLRLMKFSLDDGRVYHGLIRDDSSLINFARPFQLKIVDLPTLVFCIILTKSYFRS